MVKRKEERGVDIGGEGGGGAEERGGGRGCEKEKVSAFEVRRKVLKRRDLIAFSPVNIVGGKEFLAISSAS